MKNPLSPGEGAQSLGKILGSILGIQDSFIGSILIFLGWFITAGASGIRLYLRKKQGKAVFGFAKIYLILHLVLILGQLVIHDFIVNKGKFTDQSLWSRIYDEKLMLFYIIGLVILFFFFYSFRDFLPLKEGMEESPDYQGKGLLSFLIKGNYQLELRTNLFDPILGGIIGLWFYQKAQVENLGIWVMICSGCLLIESIVSLAQDWQIRQSKEIARVKSKEYSNDLRANEKNNQEDGITPQF